MKKSVRYWVREYSNYRPIFIRGFEWSVIAAVMYGERQEVINFVGYGPTVDAASDHAKSKVRAWALKEGSDVYFPHYV